MAFDTRTIGRWTSPCAFTVGAGQIASFAKAINDDNHQHLSGEIAPPLFAVVPIMESIRAVLENVASADVISSLRGLHGEQDIHLFCEILAGDVLISRAAVQALLPKKSGTVVVIKSETSNSDGAQVNEQTWTTFYKDILTNDGGGDTHPLPGSDDHTGLPPLALVSSYVNRDQALRYAKASGDYTAIHLDEDAAHAAGLPGIIVHGLCTLGMVSVGIVRELCDGDSKKLQRIGARFSNFVIPGEEINTALWSNSRGNDVYFKTFNRMGVTVLDRGIAVMGKKTVRARKLSNRVYGEKS